jgi:hypothetical protein
MNKMYFGKYERISTLYTISHFKRRPLRVGIFEYDLVTVTL